MDSNETINLNDTDEEVLKQVMISKNPVSPYDLQDLIKKSYFIAHKSCKKLFKYQLIDKEELKSGSEKGGKKTVYSLTIDGFCYILSNEINSFPRSNSGRYEAVINILQYCYHIDTLLKIIYESIQEMSEAGFNYELHGNPFVNSLNYTVKCCFYNNKNYIYKKEGDMILGVSYYDFHKTFFSSLIDEHKENGIPHEFLKSFILKVRQNDVLSKEIVEISKDYIELYLNDVEFIYRFLGIYLESKEFTDLASGFTNKLNILLDSRK